MESQNLNSTKFLHVHCTLTVQSCDKNYKVLVDLAATKYIGDIVSKYISREPFTANSRPYTCSFLQGTDRAGVWQRPGRPGGHQRGTASDGVGEDHPGLQERQTEASQHWEE